MADGGTLKLPTHTRNALAFSERLRDIGISSDVQQRIGAFGVAWGLFESHLERAVWILQKERVKGSRPSTDKTSVAKWIEVLESGSDEVSARGNDVLRTAGRAAKDLMSYRHSLFHGYLIPLGGTAMFIRNPQWNGEVRKREFGDAHIDENILDLAIDSAWVLFGVVIAVTKLDGTQGALAAVEAFDSEARRIRTNAGEVRHLAALMRHEKY